MRLLLRLSAIWLLFSLSSGVVGAFWLDEVWRAIENQSMVGCSALMASICNDEQWQEPWDDDPRWVDLEKRWNVDIVPLPAGEATLQISGRDDATIDGNVWTQMQSGKWRISRLVALPGTDKFVDCIQVTRVVDFSNVRRIWWMLWLATFSLGCSVVALTANTLRQHSKRKYDALQPWVDATRQIANSEVARIPESLPSDEVLAVQLSIIRESVNGWLSELQSKVQRNDLVLRLFVC
jgi:hypothetical protein